MDRWAGRARSAPKWASGALGAGAMGCVVGAVDLAMSGARRGVSLGWREWCAVGAFSILASGWCAAALAPVAVRARVRYPVSIGLGCVMAWTAVSTLIPLRLYPAVRGAAWVVALLGGALIGARLVRGVAPRWAGLAFGLAVLATLTAAPAARSQRVRGVLLSRLDVGATLSEALPLRARAAPLAARCALPPTPERRPVALAARAPVVMITVDALRADLAGDRLAETMPRTARWLAGAFDFRRAYAPAPRTHESVSALFKGLYPMHIRFDHVAVDTDDRFAIVPPDPIDWRRRHPAPVRDASPTLAQRLRRAGYDTHAVIDYLYFLRPGGITRGFAAIDDAAYQERNRDNRGVTSDVLAARLTRFLAGADAARPFFLWSHFMDPHAPYLPSPSTPPPADARARQLGELRRVDDALDGVFGLLAARGILDRAVVVFAADHGEEFGEHGGRFHGTTVFDEQTRVPLLVRVPGRQGRVVDGLASLVDVAPTVLEAVLGEPAPELDGRSLVPALLGEPMPERPVFLRSTFHEEVEGVVEDGHKLVVAPARGLAALFDLRRDPGETRDIADEAPAVAARLRCLLAAAHGAPGRPPGATTEQ